MNLKSEKAARARLDSIQALRGIASVLVLIAHAVDVSLHSGPWFGPEWMPLSNFGAFGVDIFFVISGFVMPYSLEGKFGARESARFLVHRWIRIAPPYLIVTAGILVGDLFRGREVSSISVLNAVLFVPILDTETYTEPPLSIGWTLSFEFTFYLIVAVLLWLGSRRLALNIVLTLAGLSLLGMLVPGAPYIIEWVTNPMLLEFAMGTVCYVIWRSGSVARLGTALRIIGVLAVVVLIVQIFVGYGDISESSRAFHSQTAWLRVLLWGIPATAIFLAALTTVDNRSNSMLHRFGMELGDASYSIYLVHLPLIGLVAVAMSSVSMPGFVILPVCVMVGLAAGFAYFRAVESPVTRWLRRIADRQLPS